MSTEIKNAMRVLTEAMQEGFKEQLNRTSDAFDALKDSDPEFYQELVDICEKHKDK